MRIMKGDGTVMIGERTVSHLYKLQGCIVAGGVTYKGCNCKYSSVCDGGQAETKSITQARCGVHRGSRLQDGGILAKIVGYVWTWSCISARV